MPCFPCCRKNSPVSIVAASGFPVNANILLSLAPPNKNAPPLYKLLSSGAGNASKLAARLSVSC